MKRGTVKVLKFIVKLWIFAVLFLLVVGSVGILVTQGILRFWEVMSPFNFSNFIVLVAFLLPAYLLNYVAERFEAQSLTQSQENQKKELYTIANKEGWPVVWQNSQFFSENLDTPQVDEKILMIFSRPLYALQYINSLNFKEAYCYQIENQADLEFIIGLSQEVGIERLAIDRCDFSKTHSAEDEIIISLMKLESVTSFDMLGTQVFEAEKCRICCDEHQILKTIGADTMATILKVGRTI